MVLILPSIFDLSCPKPCTTGSVSPCDQGLMGDDNVCRPVNPQCPECAAYGLYKPPFTQCCMSSDDCKTDKGCIGRCLYKDTSHGRIQGCDYARHSDFCQYDTCHAGYCVEDGTCNLMPDVPTLPCDDHDICTVGDTCDTNFPDNCKPGKNKCHGSGATYSFPESAFCENSPDLDHDNDGLIDQAEFLLADYFKPVMHFDSHENATLDYEPVTLYAATKWSDQWVKIVYAFLWHYDGGYVCASPSGGQWCIDFNDRDSHHGDSEYISVMLRTSDNGKTFTLDWYSLSNAGGYDSNPIFGGATPETLSDGSVHPVTYWSGGKHHQYFSSQECHPSSLSVHGCYDTNNDKGPTKLPDLQSIKKYCMHCGANGGGQYGNNVGETDIKADNPYFINDLSKSVNSQDFFPGQEVWGTDDLLRPAHFLGDKCTAIWHFFTTPDQDEIWISRVFPGGLTGTSTTAMLDNNRILSLSIPQTGTLRYALTPTVQTPYSWPTGMVQVDCARDPGIAAAVFNGKLYVFCVDRTTGWLSYFSTTDITTINHGHAWLNSIEGASINTHENLITNISGVQAAVWDAHLFVVYHRDGMLKYVFSQQHNASTWYHEFGNTEFKVMGMYGSTTIFTYALFPYNSKLYIAYYDSGDQNLRVHFRYFTIDEADPDSFTGWPVDGNLTFDIKKNIAELSDFNTYWDAIYGLGLGYVNGQLYMGFVSGNAPGKTGDEYARRIWAFGCDKNGNACNEWHAVHATYGIGAPDKLHFYPYGDNMVWTGTDTLDESRTTSFSFIGMKRFWR